MTTLILAAVAQISLAYVWYKIGYAKREKEFQDRWVEFEVDGHPALHVYRKDGRVIVKVLDKEFVTIKK